MQETRLTSRDQCKFVSEESMLGLVALNGIGECTEMRTERTVESKRASIIEERETTNKKNASVHRHKAGAEVFR